MQYLAPFLLFVFGNFCVFAQSDANFTGVWKLDKSKSVFADDTAGLFENQILVVNHKGSYLRIETKNKPLTSNISYEKAVILGNEIATYTTNVAFTRSEQATPAGRVRVTYQAAWKKSFLQLSQSRKFKSNKFPVSLRIDEEWRLSPDKKILTIKRKSISADGEKNYLLTYVKSNEESVKIANAKLAPKASVKSINAAVINGNALKLFLPEYPEEAQLAKAQGIVRVNIVVNENGEVVSAEAIEGDRILLKSAMEAAKKCRFSPRRIDGQLVKYTATIVYTFAIQ